MTPEEQDVYYAWQFNPWFRVKVILKALWIMLLWLVGAGICLGIIIKVALAIL